MNPSSPSKDLLMEGKKEASTHENICCEGQGTRLLSSLPEHIYSTTPDGIYVNLFEPSTIRWRQNGQPMAVTMNTKFPFEDGVYWRLCNGNGCVSDSCQSAHPRPLMSKPGDDPFRQRQSR
jgi:hypothetical protein